MFVEFQPGHTSGYSASPADESTSCTCCKARRRDPRRSTWRAMAAFCRRHHIRRLSLFGSVLRADFRADSDIDVLVEFQPGHQPAWEIIRIEAELSRLFGGHPVDMLNPRYLNRHLRDRILGSAVVQYEAEHGGG